MSGYIDETFVKDAVSILTALFSLEDSRRKCLEIANISDCL